MMNPIGVMPWMMAGQVVIWIAVVIGMVLIVREIARTIRVREQTPLAVVQRRLAEGQISQEEYEAVQRILTPVAEREAQRTSATTPHGTA